ncbi:MAG: YggS family pyridoxal phosphate-dependent enzyme [Opitutaceae bacterium]|jgi:pyridoxal phosphate enzyme (YggS family)|nr:YggS family pyridoxal phosphate-dependent enzyme [Opitutaceae bacterium]NBR58442.1 YggS family pyridoxal phosphate-dependent enzyme [Opitutaceae bacterium]
MFIEYDTFCQRANALVLRIAELCRSAGRLPSEVTLLPVTKNHPAAAAEYAVRYGLKSVGENRVQEAIDKISLAPPNLRWELIGHLQSNKAKLAAAHFSRIQSVDSEKILAALNRSGGELHKKLPILLQINAGHDPAKFGIEPIDAPHLLEYALQQPHLQVDGLMTIAPLSDDTDVARRTFANLRNIRDELAGRFGVPLKELSMGMSGDLAAAISEGSTVVRVGTALYGPRE